MNYSNNAKLIVANEISNMIYNNIIMGAGVECFESWCEDGDIFDQHDSYINWDGLEEPLSKSDIEQAKQLMKEVAPNIDAAVFALDLDQHI